MDREQHEARCILFFGEPWTEVHAFFDQYAFASVKSKVTGYPDASHRQILHNHEGVEQCVLNFGEEARCPALLHLFDDYEYFQHYNEDGTVKKSTNDRLLDEIRGIEDQEDFEDL